jgi:hypothetical protein
MTLSPRIPDAEIEANAAALQLTPATVGALSAIALEEPRVAPEATCRVLRLALATIDAAEIAASLEVRP